MTSIYLNHFRTIEPKNYLAQSDLLNWIIKCHQAAEENIAGANSSPDLERIKKVFHRYAVKPSQISKRFSECDDIQRKNFSENEIYNFEKNSPHGVDINKRTLYFAKRADEIFAKLYDLTSASDRPDHIVHVTCTGYISPSAPQKIVSDRRWGRATGITHAYHMGCYAAMPAVRLARGLVLSEGRDQTKFRCDIVHNEMCSLHMNPLAHSPEQMVIQTLFGDGHVKYTATSIAGDAGHSLRIIALSERIVPDTQEHMSWTPSPWGMQMNLSREVPERIKHELKSFSVELFKKAHLSANDISSAIFAIHPGGPQIVDAVQSVMELADEQILESRQVLFEHGNMSSATLPHIWKKILNQKYKVGTKIVSYAFGPGLTLFGSVFEVC